jgi:two-component sensor histidine kinase
VRTDGTGSARFTLSWRESGGPPVSAPQNRGFGTTVFHRTVRSGLNAAVTLDFAPAGLVWHIECPTAAVLETSSTTPVER